MAIYYVDLEKSGTGYSGVDVANAYSAEDFFTVLAAPRTAAHTFKVWGTYSNESKYVVFAAHNTIKYTIESMYPTNPFRLNMSRIDNFAWNMDFKNGIIRLNIGVFQSNSIVNNVDYRFYNCYVEATANLYIHGYNQSATYNCNVLFYGCTVKYSSFDFKVPGNYVKFYDCIVKGDGLSFYALPAESTDFQFYNCIVTHGKTFAVEMVNQNTVFNYVLPTALPAWDATKANFKIDWNIPTPPQPGNPPYTGYETDLFGYPRTGIGTYNMAKPVSALSVEAINRASASVPIVSTVDPTSLNTKINGDTNFDDQNEWQKIVVIYRHSSGQTLRLVHRLINGSWKANGNIPTTANTGQWVKQKVLLINKDGAIKNIAVTNEDISIA